MAEQITRDEWLKAIAIEEGDPYPEALTRKELQALFKLGASQVKDRLMKWQAEGKVKLVTRRRRDTSGRWVPIPAYLLVKKEK